MKVLVVEKHISSYPNPIVLKRGEVAHVGHRDSEFPGWIWTTTQAGNQGWAPEDILELRGSTATAKEAYTARELTTAVGETLIVQRELKGWYWAQNSAGEWGWIPAKTTLPAIDHCVSWRQLDGAGSEYCALRFREQGELLNGTVVTLFNDRPTLVEYQVAVDAQWMTRDVQVKMQLGKDRQGLTLIRGEHGAWQISGEDAPHLGPCLDVDLGWTPATNTLPIRRLGLSVGESAEVEAAWIRFPELTVESRPQRYTRVADRRYRYESRVEAFVTEIEVDHFGFVVDYPGLWERVGGC